MDLTLALTGALPFVVVASAALTLPISLCLLWLYRRAVLRNMNRASGDASGGRDDALAGTAPQAALRIIDSGTRSEIPARSEAPQLRAALVSPWEAALVYLLGGAAHAAVMAFAWLGMIGEGFSAMRFAWIFATYLWVGVLAVRTVLPNGPARSLAAPAYTALLAVVGAIGIGRSPDLDIAQLMAYWLIVNGPATVLHLAIQNRRIRAVGPLVLALTLAGVAGAVVLTGAVGGSDAALRAIVGAGTLAGLGATELLVLLVALGFAAFAAVGWPALRALGRAYARKRFSDRSLRLEAMFLMFAVVQAVGFVFSGLAWVLAAPVAFVASVTTIRGAFARLRRRAGPASPGPILLLLRVFALGRRSERLFEELGRRWLPTGSIALIAGPDLVTATIEPDEFLAFAGGHLSRAFVSGEDDLERRLAALDTLPDPDGRHRVNEFFCHADTWQPTMRRLAARSDAVVMDLRSFSPENRGCTYELGALLDAVPLARVVLVTDAGTDRAFLETTLRDLWSRLAPDSPNRTLPDPILRIARAGKRAEAIVPQLLRPAARSTTV